MKYPAPSKIPLIITGLTATGKTKLALQLAQEFCLNLISADSRQIFQELDIGTGKYSSDQQVNIKNEFVLINNVPVFGLNLVHANQSYSAAQYHRYLQNLLSQDYFSPAIMVGGTGQYISGFLGTPTTYFIPPHAQLRSSFAKLEQALSKANYTALLQTYLHNLSSPKYHQLNSSDVQNPRRLQRAIEVQLQSHTQTSPNENVIRVPIIGLRAPLPSLEKIISQRVDEMYELGLKSEFQNLLGSFGPDCPAIQTIGYREWLEQPALTDLEVLTLIKIHTRQYAKRQYTYLKRYSQIRWFDISTDGFAQAKEYCRNLLQTNTISL